MNAIEWLDKQVEICELQIQYQKFSEEIYINHNPTRMIFIEGIEKIAEETGLVFRRREDDVYDELFFEYKGVRFLEWKEKKDGK